MYVCVCVYINNMSLWQYDLAKASITLQQQAAIGDIVHQNNECILVFQTINPLYKMNRYDNVHTVICSWSLTLTNN